MKVRRELGALTGCVVATSERTGRSENTDLEHSRGTYCNPDALPRICVLCRIQRVKIGRSFRFESQIHRSRQSATRLVGKAFQL